MRDYGGVLPQGDQNLHKPDKRVVEPLFEQPVVAPLVWVLFRAKIRAVKRGEAIFPAFLHGGFLKTKVQDLKFVKSQFGVFHDNPGKIPVRAIFGTHKREYPPEWDDIFGLLLYPLQAKAVQNKGAVNGEGNYWPELKFDWVSYPGNDFLVNFRAQAIWTSQTRKSSWESQKQLVTAWKLSVVEVMGVCLLNHQ